jgi:hypothetical protein
VTTAATVKTTAWSLHKAISIPSVDHADLNRNIVTLCHFVGNAHRILVGNPNGSRPLGRPKYRWEDNIKTDFRETLLSGMD